MKRHLSEGRKQTSTITGLDLCDSDAGVSPMWNIFLLILFAALMVFVWEFPVVVMGYPHIFPYIGAGHTFLQTGLIPPDEGRLQVLLIALFSKWIPWSSLVGWSFMSAGIFALTIIPWWFAVRKLFSETIAWIATAVLSLMPLYWLQAVTVDKYTFSFLFLFLSFTVFVSLRERHRFAAIILSGVIFGICIAVKDTFLIFLPWLVLSYLWLNRESFRRAFIEIACAVFCIAAVFVISFLPNLLRMEGLSFDERVAGILSFSRAAPSTGELYGDEYNYNFDREWFEQDLLKKRSEEQGFLQNIQQLHRLISFNVGEQSIWKSLGSGAWLFVNRIPDLIFMDTVGGIILWLLIIPGIVVIYRKNRKLLWFFVGLMLTSDLIVRFILHFQRSHLVNTGWILAILAALGVK